MFTDAPTGRSATDVHEVLVGDTTVGALDSGPSMPVTTTSVTVIVGTPASRTGTAGADVVVFTVDDGEPVTFHLRPAPPH